MSFELITEPDNHAQMTVAGELGLNFAQPRGVDYLNSRLDVYRTSNNGVDRFDITFDHVPLDGLSLMAFLKHIAPYKRYADSAYGTIADWQILDSEPQFPSPRLVHLHERLGESWLQFAESQPAFMSTLQSLGTSVSPRFVRYAYPRPEDLKPVAEAIRTVSKRLRGDVRSPKPQLPALVELLSAAGIDDAHELVMEKLKAEVNLRRPGRNAITNPKTLYKRFNQMGHVRRSALINSLLDSIEPSQKQAVLDRIKAPGDGFFVSNEGKEFLVGRTVLKPDDQPVNEPFCIRVGAYEADFVWTQNRSGYLERRMVPGSTRLSTPKPTIQPVVSWQRGSNGKRQFIFERSASGDKGNQFTDGVLGALAVAYFAPEERSNWPEEMSIGESRKQEMRAAQVPVLALMRQTQLLRTDFIEASEALAA